MWNSCERTTKVLDFATKNDSLAKCIGRSVFNSAMYAKGQLDSYDGKTIEQYHQ